MSRHGPRLTPEEIIDEVLKNGAGIEGLIHAANAGIRQGMRDNLRRYKIARGSWGCGDIRFSIVNSVDNLDAFSLLRERNALNADQIALHDDIIRDLLPLAPQLEQIGVKIPSRIQFHLDRLHSPD